MVRRISGGARMDIVVETGAAGWMKHRHHPESFERLSVTKPPVAHRAVEQLRTRAHGDRAVLLQELKFSEIAKLLSIPKSGFTVHSEVLAVAQRCWC
jgi:hypothetical protein